MGFITAAATTAVVLLLLVAAASTASDHYLLSCGASSEVGNSYDGQTWQSDNNSTFSSDFSSTISANSADSNAAQIPFSSARVFTGNFTYSFPVSPGPKFIRLLFHPSTYSNYSPADSFLTLRSSTGHLLLRNYSAALYTTTTTIKEFYVHVSTTLLQLTFSPTPPSTHAFLNGIEIVSVPDTLYVGSTSPTDVDQPDFQFPLTNSTAFETAYRLNVGGKQLGASQDAGNMQRLWLSDEDYLSTGGFPGSTGVDGYPESIKYTAATPNYTAPTAVYQTFRWMGNVSDEVKSKVNVTWGFEVDLGFHYLLRLHWCEVTIDINNSNYRVFDVFIDGLTAERGADVFQWAGANTAIYRDYVLYIDAGDGTSSRGILQLAMHPNTQTQTMYKDILLNGLEIFKLNRANGSLDAPNPTTTTTTSPPNQKQPSSKPATSHIISVVIGAISGVVLLAVILYLVLLIRRRRRRAKLSSTVLWSSCTGKSKAGSTVSTAKSNSSLPSDLCRRFSIMEIKRATSDFNDSLIIGHGGFGNVYKGTVDMVPVAIKRLNPLSKQGAREFTTEIEMLSKLRHVNLVSLVGFCDDTGEMVLVYEYMPGGTLRDHIFQVNSLRWVQRLEACIGAARGLNYLHSGTGHMIIHRDVKSTNILLDDKWTAKMSDFGLSKLGPASGMELSHVSTAVKGSFGYVDPEYYRRQQLTEKSDVYSLGVVLFEVLCGRAAVALGLPRDQVNLAVWGRRNHLGGTLGDILDPSIKGEVAAECLRKFGEVAESCVREDGVERPSMAEVVWGLEFALKLQTEALLDPSSATPLGVELPHFSAASGTIMTPLSSSSDWLFSGSSDQAGHSVSISGTSTTVFSEILKPQGR